MKGVTISMLARLRQIVCCLALIGCATQSPVGAMDITGINYTDTVVEAFAVNGYPGPNVYPHGGGGAFVCCISVPEVWKPGMTVTVRWTDDRNANLVPWKSKVVEIPQYRPDERDIFVVHFFPNDEVKVLVTNMIVGHPNYPFPNPKTYRQK